MNQDLHHFFPNAKLVKVCQSAADKAYLPLSTNTWLEVDKTELTEREQALLSVLVKSEETALSTNPWLTFLQGQTRQMPQQVEGVQFLHVRIWNIDTDKDSRAGWLEMMAALLPMQVATIQVSSADYLFVLEQKPFVDVAEILRETLSAMEFDFGLRLTCFLGQIWSQTTAANLSQLYQEENALFSSWQEQFDQATVLTTAQLALWGQANGTVQLKASRHHLKQRIVDQDMTDIILALWQEGAVATKAAQRLYIHRNTLQYRLEKWHELTGLQLRDLTDLAFCHSLVLEDAF